MSVQPLATLTNRLIFRINAFDFAGLRLGNQAMGNGSKDLRADFGRIEGFLTRFYADALPFEIKFEDD